MPNLWVALIAVAATAGLARRRAIGEGRYDELLAGGLVAIAALIRPLDAVVLTAALILLPIAVRRATVPWVVHLVLGLAAGWAPWVVEMTARFGSPGEAFAAAARLGHTGHWSLFENARQYLALSDGPSIGPVLHPDVPISGALWLIGLAILVGSGIVTANRRGLLPTLVVPTAAGLALATEYIVFTDAQAPRFLLPAMSLLTIPAGLGLVSIVTRRDREQHDSVPFLAGAATAIVVLAWVVVQLGIAARVEAGVVEQRGSAERAGLRVRRLSAGEPCHVYAEGSFPIVGFAARCRAAPLGKVLAVWRDRAGHLERDGVRVFLVLHRTQALPSLEGTALLAVVPSQGDLRWFIYGRP
jgi:4-amino-4-deoxy-L-arabinose transferase-like glycosyltransferase